MRPEPTIDNDTYTVTDLNVGYDPADTYVEVRFDVLDVEVLRQLLIYVAQEGPEVHQRMAATIAANWFDDAYDAMGGEKASEVIGQRLDAQFEQAGISYEEAKQAFLDSEGR